MSELGDIYRIKGDLEAALQQLDEALTLSPEDARTWAYRGETKFQLKRFEEAIWDFDHAIALDKNYTWAIAIRGLAHSRVERYEDALRDFDRAISLDNSSAWTFSRRGDVYRSLKRYDEALADFNYAIKLNEKYTLAIFGRGRVYQALKRYQDALTDFTTIIALDAKNTRLISSRGYIYLLLQNFAEAQIDLTKALSIEENDWGFYSRGLSYLLQSQLTEAQSDLTRAIELADPDYAKDPHNWRNTLNLMLYHLVAGDNSAAAERFLQEAIDKPAPLPFGALPTDRPIAVYYRQSSMAQIGNISTDMQQIDLPRYVMSLGWRPEQIILIDEDEGVSGAKRIDERKGMSRLFDLMLTRKIGAVATQAEDRLFRDKTQVQVNVFIDACVKNDIRVLTPHFKYHFADEHEGHYHDLLFRMRTEQAADFLNFYVRGRLYAAKERMLLQGMWMGGNITFGYMVDDRKTLPDGQPNPNWRKYQPFAPCAEVVVKIFETFVMLGGNRNATQRYLYENGPHLPDFDHPDLIRQVPPGFCWAKPMRMLRRNSVYIAGVVALPRMLTNAAYLGHWVFKDCVVQWNNHPAIVPEDLFYQAFNYISPCNLDGTPNEHYAPRLGKHNSTKKQKRDAYEPV